MHGSADPRKSYPPAPPARKSPPDSPCTRWRRTTPNCAAQTPPAVVPADDGPRDARTPDAKPPRPDRLPAAHPAALRCFLRDSPALNSRYYKTTAAAFRPPPAPAAAALTPDVGSGTNRLVFAVQSQTQNHA